MKFLSKQPLFFVVSAPSGGGKTTVCNNLLAHNPNLVRAITCTTRPPREGEVDGKDYYFLSKATFEQKRDAGEFVEWANVYGNFYGTLKKEILERLRAGMDVIVSVDVQGVQSINRLAQKEPLLAASLVTLFIALPTVEDLRKRLEKRASDAPEVIERRLQTARSEMATCGEFQYLLLSGTPEEDYNRAQGILWTEKMKRSRVTRSELEHYVQSFR